MYKSLNYGNNNNGDETMNSKIVVWIFIVMFSIIVGTVTYRIVRRQNNTADLLENTSNSIEISETTEINEDAVTDECLDEWNDYNEYISDRVEEASNNILEEDTHYLLKDVYGNIEVYYLDENGKEYLYKKTSISTDYLSDEDKYDLKKGIEVVGIEALNKMLEDFE